MTRSAIMIALAAVAFWLVGLQLEPRGYPIRALCLLLLAASMAQSWNIVGGLTNQISLGHAAFFGIGAYTSTILLIYAKWPPWFGMLAGMALAAAAALLLAWPTMRLKGPYFALATLAFAEACRVIANSLTITNGAQDGITLVVVEHHMRAIMGLYERILVLDFGRLIAAGTPAEIAADPAVIAAYLGQPEAGADHVRDA